MRAGGKGGMTDAQISDFVARFQPAYQAYLPGLYAKVGSKLLGVGRVLLFYICEVGNAKKYMLAIYLEWKCTIVTGGTGTHFKMVQAC